jgi:hypothetical protein
MGPKPDWRAGWAGGGEAAVGAAVEGLGEGQDLVLAGAVVVVGVLAGQLDGGLDALGARVAEKDPVEVRGVVSCAATSAWIGISYRLEQCMSFSAWSLIAPTSAGCPCPRELVAIPPIKSR